MSTLGERIRDARIAAGFDTAGDGAARLGVEAARYRHWEADRREPPIDVLVQMARVYKVDLEWLASGKGETDSDRAAINSIYDAMSPGERKTVRKMIEGLKPDAVNEKR